MRRCTGSDGAVPHVVAQCVLRALMSAALQNALLKRREVLPSDLESPRVEIGTAAAGVIAGVRPCECCKNYANRRATSRRVLAPWCVALCACADHVPSASEAPKGARKDEDVVKSDADLVVQVRVAAVVRA